MKHIRLTIKVLFIAVIIYSCTPDEPEGIFNLSEAAQKYKIDTTITSFQMIDNNGLTEGFYLNNYNSYFHRPWANGLFEIYNLDYKSVLNNYNFTINLRADDISSTLSLNWNYNNYVYYDFKTTEVYGEKATPILKFYNSITIQNTIYYDIIEIDFSEKTHKIDDKTPVKTYISGEKGLIKLIRKDGVVLERIN